MTYIAVLFVMFLGQQQPSKLVLSGLPNEEACQVTMVAMAKGLWATERALVVDQTCKPGEQS